MTRPATTLIRTKATVGARSSLFWRGVFLLALAAFAAAATYQLRLPGLTYDEAADAVPAMNVVLHQVVQAKAVIHVAGQDWPLMIMPYVGPTSTYLALPTFWLAGVSVEAWRLTTVALGLLTLGLAWAFLREYLDERVAGLAVLLLAVDPTYVFWSRMGAWVALPMLPIFILALWLLFRWYQRVRPGYLVGAALCLGLGLTTKLLFVWAWGALIVAWLLLSPWIEQAGGWRRWLWPARRAGIVAWLLAMGAAILGASGVIVYNLRSAESLEYFSHSVLSPEKAAFRGLDTLVAKASAGISGLRVLLDGSWFASDLGGPHTNPLAWPAFLVGALVILALALSGRLVYSRKRLALLGTLLICVLAESAVTHTGQGAYHLVILWPIPQTVIATALVGSADALGQAKIGHRRLYLGLIGAIAVVLVGAAGWTTYRYHRTLSQTGGIGLFSDAIYDLAHDLQQPGAPMAYAMDWGFWRNLALITENRVHPQEYFTYSRPPEPVFVDYLDYLMEQPVGLYLFHAPDHTVYPGHWELFDRAAYRHHLTPQLWKTYRQRDGQPVYLVYKLDPAAPLAAMPAGTRTLNVRLGDSLALLGYDVPASQVLPGTTAEATLFWQAADRQTRSYKVFGHLLDASGKVWAMHDSIPMDWSYPTNTWKVGEVVPDRLWLPLPSDAPAGTYTLFIGMYDPETGQRVPLWRDGARLQGDTMELTHLVVGE